MTDPYHFIPGSSSSSWDEHNIIQPLLVLFLKGGRAPAGEVILHKNCVDRGLMQVDLFGEVEFTKQGLEVLEEYDAYTSTFTFY